MSYIESNNVIINKLTLAKYLELKSSGVLNDNEIYVISDIADYLTFNEVNRSVEGYSIIATNILSDTCDLKILGNSSLNGTPTSTSPVEIESIGDNGSITLIINDVAYNIILNEPLRSLPNGTKDTIEKVDGVYKIVRRIKKVILNGNEEWSEAGSYNNGYRSYWTWLNDMKPNGDKNAILTNRFTFKDEGMWDNPDGEYSRCDSTDRAIYVSLSLDKAETTSECANWMSNNNTIVLYELENPIYELIDFNFPFDNNLVITNSENAYMVFNYKQLSK